MTQILRSNEVKKNTNKFEYNRKTVSIVRDWQLVEFIFIVKKALIYIQKSRTTMKQENLNFHGEEVAVLAACVVKNVHAENKLNDSEACGRVKRRRKY